MNVASADADAVKKALDIIRGLTAEAEIGATYTGTVKRITDFGAFVEILPNTDGLLHISEMAHTRVERVEDVLKEGDTVDVKVLSVDREGKIRLSRRELLPLPEGRRGRARRRAHGRMAREGGGGPPRRDGPPRGRRPARRRAPARRAARAARSALAVILGNAALAYLRPLDDPQPLGHPVLDALAAR